MEKKSDNVNQNMHALTTNTITTAVVTVDAMRLTARQQSTVDEMFANTSFSICNFYISVMYFGSHQSHPACGTRSDEFASRGSL